MNAVMVAPPQTITELHERAMQLAGQSIGDIAQRYKVDVPANLLHHKGWLGDFMESVLGADAGNLSEADFQQLGIELKTIPLNAKGHPAESTFVCSIDMDKAHHLDWQQSRVYRKLRHVLFIPIHSHNKHTIQERIIATPLFWQPSSSELNQLKQDWLESMELIQLGKLEQLDSRTGKYLQVRPKAANARMLTQAIDEDGESCLTLPRGFYLRASFTRHIFQSNFL